ncbi:MAG: NAD kinase [Bacteroidota bacterium]|nr:NAD kinase [Bacteroidota bacterium]
MRIALFGKRISDQNLEYLRQLIERLEAFGARLTFYEPFHKVIKDLIVFKSAVDTFKSHQDLEGKVDFLLSIGGDGTLLDTMTLVRDSGIPVMGVNLGRLGFLSSISKDEIDSALDDLKNGNYILDKRTLLKLKTETNLFGQMNYALNDLTINRKDSTALIVIHVWVDDIFLGKYWADGLIVATPTGSTAYSLSSGGPILTPGSENFVITPIAPHNLTIRPIVISDKSKIRIKVEGRDKQYLVSLDSRSEVFDPSVELLVEKENFQINLVQTGNKTFFNTIRDKLKWGLDIRN